MDEQHIPLHDIPAHIDKLEAENAALRVEVADWRKTAENNIDWRLRHYAEADAVITALRERVERWQRFQEHIPTCRHCTDIFVRGGVLCAIGLDLWTEATQPTPTPEPTDALRERVKRYERALRHIRDHLGKVCPDFELCDHDACQSSYAAWAEADRALSATPEPTTPPRVDCVHCCGGEHECPEAGCDCCDGRCLCKCHRRESQQEPLSPLAGAIRRVDDAQQALLEGVRQLLCHRDQQSRQAERQRVLGVLDARIAELNLYDNEDNEAAGGELYGYQWLQRHLRQPQQGGNAK